ncbi:MAG: DUF6804 family protein [Alphaproteobacteria bacterium]
MENLQLIFNKSFGHKLAMICFAVSIIAILSLPYSFYVLVRLVFFVGILWCGWQLYLKDDKVTNIHFVLAGLAILYNPVFLIHLGSKLLWLIINLGTAFFIYKISNKLVDGEIDTKADFEPESVKPEKVKATSDASANKVAKKVTNKPEKSVEENSKTPVPSDAGLPIYKLTLQKTYFNTGFFNVGVKFERYVTKSDEDLTIYVGPQKQSISGRSSRKYNNNGTPRIFGGTSLRDWFQKNFEVKDAVDVTFMSPTKVWLTKAK